MGTLTKVVLTIILLSIGMDAAFAVNGYDIVSLYRQISVSVLVTPEGQLSYSVKSDGFTVVEPSSPGIEVDSIDLGKNARITSIPTLTKINESYPVLGNYSTAYNRGREREVKIPMEETNATLLYDDKHINTSIE